MEDLKVLITVAAADRAGIIQAREDYNASQPATVEGPADEAGVPTQVPNPDLIATDEDYIAFVMRGAVASYKRNLRVAPAPVPDPSPVTVGSVPQSVSRKQGRAALILAGLLDQVQPMIDAIPDATQRALTQNAWDSATSFDRQDPFLKGLAAGLGLDDAALDQLFITASKL